MICTVVSFMLVLFRSSLLSIFFSDCFQFLLVILEALLKCPLTKLNK